MKRITVLTGGCLAALAVIAVAQDLRPTTEGRKQEVKTFPGDRDVVEVTMEQRSQEPRPKTVLTPLSAYVDVDARGPGQQRAVLILDMSPKERDFAKQAEESLANWKAAEDDAARDEAKEQLRSALEEIFSLRQQAHDREITELEEQVKQLREQLERRREKWEEIIGFRVEQLLREAEGLGWGAEPGSGYGEDRFPGGLGGSSPIGGRGSAGAGNERKSPLPPTYPAQPKR